MGANDTCKELADLLKVGQKLIWLVSFEEARAEGIIAVAAKSLGKDTCVWSRTAGLVFLNGPDPSGNEPAEALTKISGLGDKTVAILRDFHAYVDDPRIVRALKDFISKPSSPDIIILSPSDIQSPELRKTFVTLHLPTPDAKELKAILKEVLKDQPIKASQLDLMVLAALGLTSMEARRAFKLAKLGRRSSPVEEVLAQKRRLSTAGSALEFLEQSEEFNHIGGLSELKSWLTKRRRAFGDKARDFGLPPPRGLLLLGVQGCGKSLTAKAVSKLWNVPLLRLDLSILGTEGGEAKLENALALSASVAPAILWIDEIEKGFAEHSTNRGFLPSRMLSTFVIWLQEKKAPVFVVATANSISDMPPELLRKGRFDEIFFVDLPNEIEREEIFGIHLSKRKRDLAEFDLKALAKRSNGMSGAEIEEALVSALYEAFDENTELKQKHIVKSIKATVPLAKTMEEKIKELKDWAKGRARVSSPDTRTEDLLKG